MNPYSKLLSSLSVQVHNIHIRYYDVFFVSFMNNVFCVFLRSETEKNNLELSQASNTKVQVVDFD